MYNVITQKKSVVVFSFFAALSLILCVIVPVPSDKLTYVPLLTGLATILFGFWVYFSRQERAGNWCHPIIIFSLTFLIVYFQMPLFLFMGGEISDAFRFQYYKLLSPDYLQHACALAFCAFSFFFLGYYFFSRPYSLKKPLIDSDFFSKIHLSPEFCRQLSLYLIIPIVAGYVFYFLTVDKSFFQGRYSFKMLRSNPMGATILNDAHILMFISMLMQSLYVLSTGPTTLWQYALKFDKRLLISFALLIFPFVVVGSRINLFLPGLFFIAPCFLYFKPLKLHVCLILLVLGALFLTGIKINRETKYVKAHPMISDSYKQNFVKQSWYNVMTLKRLPTEELAMSQAVLTSSADIAYNMPELQKYHFPGLYTFFEITDNTIPFNRTLEKLVFGHLVLDSTERTTRENLMIHCLGENPNWSPDSTSLTTVLFDFGCWGIPFVMFLLGTVYRWVEEKAYRDNSLYAIFAFCFLIPFSLLVNRSSLILQLVIPLCKACLFLFFVLLIAKLIQREWKMDSFSRRLLGRFQNFYAVRWMIFTFLSARQGTNVALNTHFNKIVAIFLFLFFCLLLHSFHGGYSHHILKEKYEKKIELIQQSLDTSQKEREQLKQSLNLSQKELKETVNKNKQIQQSLDTLQQKHEQVMNEVKKQDDKDDNVVTSVTKTPTQDINTNRVNTRTAVRRTGLFRR